MIINKTKNPQLTVIQPEVIEFSLDLTFPGYVLAHNVIELYNEQIIYFILYVGLMCHIN